MYLAVQAVLNSHTTDWKGLPAFATGVEELAELIQNIQSLAQVQTSRSGAAADKAQAFQTLAQSAYEVAAATRACALANGNRELAQQADLSPSDMMHGRDSEFVSRCQQIHALATQYLRSLAPYGITAAKLSALKDNIQTFQTAQPNPRRVRAVSSAATRQLREFFQRTDTLLKGRLDGLAVQLKNKPDLYNAYRTARRIVDQPGTHATKPPAKTITTSVTLSKAA